MSAKPVRATHKRGATTDTIRALIQNIIDYAGLFPPARLDMLTTVRNYAAYLAGEDAWMLGRLIVPVSRLHEFEQSAADLLPKRGEDDPWQISALAAPAGDPALVDDLARIEAFNDRHHHARHGSAQIDAIELTADSTATIEAALDAMPDDLFPYFELPIGDDPRGLMAALAGADAGAKVRTGGMKAEGYPSAANLARFIAAAAGANVPFKATAGLHHPLHHRNTMVGAEEFGFLNVFVAACLADQLEMPEPEIERVLVESSIDAFAIDDRGIGWRGRSITLEQIAQSRENLAVSFGSCSFDEPREDLRVLRML